MPKTVNLSQIEDWNELDDYEKAELVASIRKQGGSVTGLDPKDLKELSRLGGYPDLPDMPPPPKVEMKTDYKVPMAVQLGSSFVGGAIPGAKAGAALGATMGPIGGTLGGIAGGLAGGGLAAGLDYEMSRRMSRPPEGGSARNAVNVLSGLVPGGAGIRAGMLRAGAEGAISQALDNRTNISTEQVNPLLIGAGSSVMSGALNVLPKSFGDRTRKVANEKDLTDWLRARMGTGSQIHVGKQAQEVLDAANVPQPSYVQSVKEPGKYEGMLRDIRERTGFDPLSLTKDDRAALTEMAGKVGKTNDEIFNEILSPIFSAKKTDELPAAAESVRKGIDSLSKASGKSREEFAKGLRKNFVQSVLGDEDIVNRPDSFRFRLEALGPDVVNELFSSAGRKGERSGAYHALMNLAEAATKGSGNFKVLLSPSGVTILDRAADMAQRVPGVGKVVQHLGLDKNKSYKLDSENDFDAASRVGELLTIGATSLAHPYAGVAAGLGVAGREVLRGAHFTWEKAIEKFAARSNRASDILRILASGEQRFSRPMINNFMNSLAKDADEKIGWD